MYRWIFFFRDVVGGFRLVRCTKRMLYSAFPHLYYVSEIRNNNVQNESFRMYEGTNFTLRRYFRNDSS